MRTLVVNAGSSSLKLSVIEDDVENPVAATTVDPWRDEHDTGALAEFVRAAGALDAVGHRVVHGGTRFRSAVMVDDAVRDQLAALTPLAPLHQPRALAGMAAARAVVGDGVPAVACFDTAFHATLPDAASTYAVALEWRSRWGVRRFGFHGLSHAWAARRAGPASRMVTCHLGAGASLCAVLDGRSVDTTMGFTPLEGVVMATRSGTVDPGLVLWLQQQGGQSAAEVWDGLEHRSGVAGLSGVASGDLREVVPRAEAGDAAARLAVDVWVHRLRSHVASMAAALGGLDALVFTGGVGEHQPPLRAAAAEGLAFLGVALDVAANASAVGVDADITAPGAAVRTHVVVAREDLEIARQVRAALSNLV